LLQRVASNARSASTSLLAFLPLALSPLALCSQPVSRFQARYARPVSL
jgi:hypothetical protein